MLALLKMQSTRLIKGNIGMKKLLITATLILGAVALSGCDIGVLSLDLGMSFDQGASVIVSE